MATCIWNVLLKIKEVNFESTFAILVLNQPILCDAQMVKSLWEKASCRAIADGGSNRWIDFIKKESGDNLKMPDFIAGDLDSILPNTKNYFTSKGVPLLLRPDQDATDFSKSLICVKTLLEERNVSIKECFVLCENSGRFDQVVGNINTLHCSNQYLPDVPLIILSSQCITWVLPPGKHIILVSDDYIEKKCCGLIPFRGPTKITTKGLKWNLNKDVCEFGGLVSTSNTYAANEIHIECDSDLVWTTEY